MNGYVIDEIRTSDTRMQAKLDALLMREGIRRDPYLDYSVGAFDDRNELIATGSAYRATIRCVAVEPAHRGEGLLARLLTALTEWQVRRGYTESFLYTKPQAAPMFRDLGFHEIERVGEKLVFMTNRANALHDYIASLGAPPPGRAAAVVMNANPFTLGHLHLLETAARENDAVHAFVVSEDVSLVPADVRMRLVREGAAHIPGVRLHPAGNYMVSTATFPSYFLKDDAEVTQTQALLDVRVFARIAAALCVTRRYAGEEPHSEITRAYNGVMRETLPALGIEFVEIPRATIHGQAVSASYVRQLIHDGPVDAIRPFVPPPTYEYFAGDAARGVVEAIRAQDHVVHD